MSNQETSTNQAPHKITTSVDISSVVWNACDTFRGTLDSSQYKDYILTMLFIKCLSDAYKEKRSDLQIKYNGDENRVNKMLEIEKFKLSPNSTFDFLYENKNAVTSQEKGTKGIGELINIVLETIEEDNKAKLGGVFRNIDFNSEKSLGSEKTKTKILTNLLDDFNKLDLSPSKLDNDDVIGDAYEFLISKFASDAGKKGGEFFTPSQVSSLLSKLTQATAGDRVYDPTCGSGSLLIKASKEVGNHNFQIYGQEKNGQTHALCRMNMFLHQIEDAKIEWGDTINNPLHRQSTSVMKFDVVVANPPFSLDKWAGNTIEKDIYKRFNYGIPPKSKGDYAFVQHMIASLNENGRMAVVLPHGVLFRGASEGKIRKGIIEDNLLDTVIGLPANIFYGTSIPVCVLVLKKNRTTDDILFIDASKEFEKEKNQNLLTNDHLTSILNVYNNREEKEKFSHVATKDEIIENDYNLNIPRYVDTFEDEELLNIDDIVTDINNLEDELQNVQSEILQACNELGIKPPFKV